MAKYSFGEFIEDLRTGREFEFTVNKIQYFISRDDSSYLFTHNQNSVSYGTAEELLKSVRIDGKMLDDIINNNKYEDLTVF